VAISAALLLAACSSKPADTGGGTGAGSTNSTTTSSVPQGPQPGSVEEFKQNVGDRVFFGTDRFDLTAEAQAELQKQATWLKTYPQYRFVIEGHCDERGTREYNLALGERRATAVRDYLVNLGIGNDRIQVVSKGKEAPVCTDHTESCWQQNRRGHFVITAK